MACLLLLAASAFPGVPLGKSNHVDGFEFYLTRYSNQAAALPAFLSPLPTVHEGFMVFIRNSGADAYRIQASYKIAGGEMRSATVMVSAMERDWTAALFLSGPFETIESMRIEELRVSRLTEVR